MRGEAKCDLDELIRLERCAAAAVEALQIVEKRPEMPKPWEILSAAVAARQLEAAGADDEDGEGE